MLTIVKRTIRNTFRLNLGNNFTQIHSETSAVKEWPYCTDLHIPWVWLISLSLVHLHHNIASAMLNSLGGSLIHTSAPLSYRIRIRITRLSCFVLYIIAMIPLWRGWVLLVFYMPYLQDGGSLAWFVLCQLFRAIRPCNRIMVYTMLTMLLEEIALTILYEYIFA